MDNNPNRHAIDLTTHTMDNKGEYFVPPDSVLIPPKEIPGRNDLQPMIDVTRFFDYDKFTNALKRLFHVHVVRDREGEPFSLHNPDVMEFLNAILLSPYRVNIDHYEKPPLEPLPLTQPEWLSKQQFRSIQALVLAFHYWYGLPIITVDEMSDADRRSLRHIGGAFLGGVIQQFLNQSKLRWNNMDGIFRGFVNVEYSLGRDPNRTADERKEQLWRIIEAMKAKLPKAIKNEKGEDMNELFYLSDPEKINFVKWLETEIVTFFEEIHEAMTK